MSGDGVETPARMPLPETPEVVEQFREEDGEEKWFDGEEPLYHLLGSTWHQDLYYLSACLAAITVLPPCRPGMGATPGPLEGGHGPPHWLSIPPSWSWVQDGRSKGQPGGPCKV